MSRPAQEDIMSELEMKTEAEVEDFTGSLCFVSCCLLYCALPVANR